MLPLNLAASELLIVAAKKLEPLLDDIVFVGGATTPIFITDPGAPKVRPTKDVDVIVEIYNHGDLASLEKRLRELGFRQPDEDPSVICRWQKDDLIVDVMPTNAKILGFSNRWYPDALETAVFAKLRNGAVIRHVTPPLFVGTKLEAFEGRGNRDFMASHDFEDLISIIDGRPSLVEEVREASEELQVYIAERFTDYVDDSAFHDALPGLVEGTQSGAERAEITMTVIEELCHLARR